MPGAHRHEDSRKCGGSTNVTGQTNVRVNGKLWAVEGDQCLAHGPGGSLLQVYGSGTVKINGKKVICALGDTASDNDSTGHPPGPVDPKGHSNDVIVYGGGAGGG
jgi:uncharacterized Zn-binding protein involved in type VI secretion